MPRVVIALIAVVVLVAALAGGAEGAKCKPGVHAFGDGGKARTFCGPARARLQVNANQTHFRQGGRCRRKPKSVKVRLGTRVLRDGNKPLPGYFALTAGRRGKPAAKDGSYENPVIRYVNDGARHKLSNATVTLQDNRTRGTFTGFLKGPGGTVTGNFHCS